MAATIENNADDSITVSVTFTPGPSMFESELTLQSALNEAGAAATGDCLSRFDTDGGKVVLGGRKMTAEGRVPKIYQTPYGEIAVGRHVYQCSSGGAVYCPLERDARIMRTATPLYAKPVAINSPTPTAGTAVTDIAQHGRVVTRSYIGEVASDVASVVVEKEDCWIYAVPGAPAGSRVRTVGIGVDGTCTLCVGDGWRQVMLDEFEKVRAKLGDRARRAAALDRAISYIGNHLPRMDYHLHGLLGLPIGSGVTEAACKSVVKERLCGSGMKWGSQGAADVLELRAMVKSKGRWEEFWSKAARFGFSKITHPKRRPH